MSALVGVFSRDGGPVADPLVRAMLRSDVRRGADHSEVWTEGPCGLGVGRHGWELAAGLGGPALLAREHGLTVAADATLYYRAELREALGKHGTPPSGDTAGQLILAAYRAWGDRCVERLEGDFAFVLWDAPRRRMVFARDLAGSRPLHYATMGDTVLVASTARAILGHPGCPRDYDVAYIAEMASGLLEVGDGTRYSAISCVGAAERIVCSPAGLRRARFWTPPAVTPFRRTSMEEGAEELRLLLGEAVLERSDPDGPTSVWMSGGRDSTAVYAAGMGMGGHRALKPVSLSYPHGDAGREDEYIGSVLRHWCAEAHWIEARSVREWGCSPESATGPGAVFFLPFEATARALVAGSRAVGSRVALNGAAGDGLLALSPAYLSELFYSGRWGQCVAEWRGHGFHGLSWLRRWVIGPGLPRSIAALAGLGRGGARPRGHLERPVPPWIASGVSGRGRGGPGERSRAASVGRGPIAREMEWFLTHPYRARVSAEVAGRGVEGGVEIRQPFLDRRVIDFAARRPWWEKSQGGETKILLRKAMRGLLPDDVLADRGRRTGIAGVYYEPATRRAVATLVRSTFADSVLADLGIVHVPELIRVADRFGIGGASSWTDQIFRTLHAEMWLQGVRGGTRAARVFRRSAA